MLNFAIIKMVATIFTPDFSLGNKVSLINLFQKLSGEKFDGELLSVPIPQVAPAEIPRIVLNSANNTWKLEVSLARTSLIFFKPLVSEVTPPDLPTFGDFAGNFYKSYKKETDIKIQRLALITERYTEIENKAPSQFLANKFCKDEFLTGPFNRTSEFELHSLKKYEHEGFKTNSWVRLKSSKLANEERTPVMLVINDINTYSQAEDPNVNFGEDDLELFFVNMPNHLESILTLYF